MNEAFNWLALALGVAGTVGTIATAGINIWGAKITMIRQAEIARRASHNDRRRDAQALLVKYCVNLEYDCERTCIFLDDFYIDMKNRNSGYTDRYIKSISEMLDSFDSYFGDIWKDFRAMSAWEADYAYEIANEIKGNLIASVEGALHLLKQRFRVVPETGFFVPNETAINSFFSGEDIKIYFTLIEEIKIFLNKMTFIRDTITEEREKSDTDIANINYTSFKRSIKESDEAYRKILYQIHQRQHQEDLKSEAEREKKS